MSRVALDYPHPAPPALGTTLEVAPGLHWLRMGLPFDLDHINLWLIENGTGWAVVDTGVDDPPTRAAWERVLSGRRLDQLICTHFHPDHMGLAGWLAQRHGVTLTATQGEWVFGRLLTLETGEDYVANQVEHHRKIGFDPRQLDGIRSRSGRFRDRVHPLPPVIHTVREGSVLHIGTREWQVVEGSGHSPQHACLYCAADGILIAGDQILPAISPLVGVWPQQPDDNPLADFLASLEKLKTLPADTLVLPSHGLPFRGLRERADELIAHHQERLERTRNGADHPATVLELTAALFRRQLDDLQLGFAVGETLAHANYLVTRGELRRTLSETGLWLFEKV